MLPKTSRLSKKIIETQFKKARRAQTPHFFVLYTKTGLEKPKIGASVSKKVEKKAVDRNRIRRRVYAAVGALIPNIKKGTGVILQFRKSTHEPTKGELEEELATVFKDVGII